MTTTSGLGLIGGVIIDEALNHGYSNGRDLNGFRYFACVDMACFALAAITCSFAHQPLPTKLQKELPFNQKLTRLDWIGYGFVASCLVLFSVASIWSQDLYSWTNPHVYAAFAAGAVLGLVLIAYETLVKKAGMFHHGLFLDNRNFTVGMICVFCQGVAFFSLTIYFPFQVS